MRDHEEHECEVFDKDIQDGYPLNLGTDPHFNSMPVRVEDCTGWVKDIQKLVELISQNSYVSIIGKAGIGKSTIMKEVCHFIHERGYFWDGSIFVFLNDCYSADDFVEKLSEAMGIQPFEKNKLQIGR